MKLIFGLGNPGFRYRNTRHNAGFRVCRAYAGLRGWKFRLRDGFSRYLIAGEGDEQVLMGLPQTYMNHSGIAVKALLEKYPAPRDRVLVVVDDIQLPLGSLRFRYGGSSGGHKGLQSICDEIGEDYGRMRIGIGPKPPAHEIISFVLGRWKWKERKPVKTLIQNAWPALDCFLNEGIQAAMNKHNFTAKEANRP